MYNFGENSFNELPVQNKFAIRIYSNSVHCLPKSKLTLSLVSCYH